MAMQMDCNSTEDNTSWKLRREFKVLLGAEEGKIKAGRIVIKRRSPLNTTFKKDIFIIDLPHRIYLNEYCERGKKVVKGSNFLTKNLVVELLWHLRWQPIKDNQLILLPLEMLQLKIVQVLSDFPMSPKKALRAALLKKRFADIIFKATHQKLLDHSDNLDPLKRQQERERLEREKKEEKAKINAQIKAAKAASWRREQEDLKMRCVKERKAARMALEKIEKSVEINDNVGILKNLEMMSCRYLYYPIDANRMGFDGIHHGSPLEQLGLYIKDDNNDVFEEEDDDVIGEEGEILS